MPQFRGAYVFSLICPSSNLIFTYVCAYSPRLVPVCGVGTVCFQVDAMIPCGQHPYPQARPQMNVRCGFKGYPPGRT